MDLLDRLNQQKIIPVVTFTKVDQVKPYLDLLIGSGINTIEIVLRSDQALHALETARHHIEQSGAEGFSVGAGTIRSVEQLNTAVNAGAQYALSPGIEAELIVAAKKINTPFVPGIATPSEVMQGLVAGCDCFKFFPAGAFGGAAALRAFSGPFPEARFCPTGGVSQETMGDYLALPNVFAVGGTWLAPLAALENSEWAMLETLMSTAVMSLSALTTATR